LPFDRVERTDNFSYFPDSGVQSSGKSRGTTPPVDGAKGLQTLIGADRNQAIGFIRKRQSASIEAFEKIGIQGAHIASDDQIQFEAGVQKRRFHTGQGTVARTAIGNYGVAQPGVFLRVANDAGAAGGRLNQCGILLDQSHTVDLQESLVRPHPRAVPARQDVTGYAHAEMIALKFVPISRLSALMVLACLPALLCAEESVSTRTTLVVKADNRSGRLVRSVIVAPKVVIPGEPDRPEPATAIEATSSLSDMIDSIAAKHDVEGPLVHSVIQAESNYNPLAVSPKGAQGLMQLIPSTAKRFGVSNTFNAEQNIEGGVKYLKFLMELYHNDYVKVIAAYNAGEAAVTKYGGIPPYAETRNYVYQVGKNLQTARKVAEVKNAAPKAEEPKQAAVTNPDQPHSIQAVIGPDGKLYYKTQ
jgi:Transglycosylase SLT domain